MTEHRAIPPLTLSLESGLSSPKTFVFETRFTIGRHSDCDVRLEDNVVSRRHADIIWENNQWWLVDLQSANGVFIDGSRIEKHPLSGSGHFQLGSVGPMFQYRVARMEPEPSAPTEVSALFKQGQATAENTSSLEHYKAYYFGKNEGSKAGEHTMMVRRAFAEIQKKQRFTYLAIIGFVLLLLAATAAVALYKHRQVIEQRKLAAEIFYTLRSLEIDLLKLRTEAEHLRSVKTKIQIDTVQAQKEKLEQSYDSYVKSLEVYTKGMSEEEKIILRMAHNFGECEINMPKGFSKEVMKYIEKWRSSQRLAKVIERAKRLRYIPRIVRAMAEQQLPAQFLYLAVQESNLNHRAVGPPTRFGIAKGMWQFIPSTAQRYGLKVGPLKDDPEVDLLDERHDVAKSTEAASRYLRYIYTTDAQASGLLVMAAYNWGEDRVIELIRSMPANPRDRNFWQLITKYRDKIPEETYDYVFSIFSAAVIGENPRLFGFDFDNPLALTNRPKRG